MDLEKAQEVLRGYMSPRNEAINIFAQTGKITESLESQVTSEVELVDKEMRQTLVRERHRELKAMYEELVSVLEFLGDRVDIAPDPKPVMLALFGYEAVELKAIVESFREQMRFFSQMKHATSNEVELYRLKSAFAESIIARIEALETE